MSKNKSKTQAPKKKKKELTPRDIMKLEIAKELGIYERVERDGWAGLSAQEAGLVGGIMSHRLRKTQNYQKPSAKQG